MARKQMLITALVILASSAHALEFSRVLHCNESKGSPWCLEREFPKGRKIFFLERKGCNAVTGDAHPVSTMIADFQGTALERFVCPEARGGEIVVFDLAVKSYVKLQVKEVPKKDFPKDLDSRLRERDDFKKLLARTPDQEQMPPPSLELRLHEVIRGKNKGKVLIATYTEDGEMPYLITQKGIAPLVDFGGMGIGNEFEGFRLNDTDYLTVNACQIGTDGCGTTHVELGK